jgi:rubrerythrin
MKPITFLLVLLLPATMAMSQGKPAPRTIEGLKTAYAGELNASAKYAKYAEKAAAENLPAVAQLFKATSKAESIHATNHKRVLDVMKVKVDTPAADPITVKTTPENLADGIKGETYEFRDMYPPFLDAADKENANEALVSFRYALETEKRHAKIYQSALDALQAKAPGTISAKWYVCPTCGNTYDMAGLPISCEFCGTLKPRFISF